MSICLLLPVYEELEVSIMSVPGGDRHQAGSSLSLNCQVDGGHEPISYYWNSTCAGDCFTRGQNTPTVSRDVLWSIDSGNYTCFAKDYVGHTGSATTEIAVTGQLY